MTSNTLYLVNSDLELVTSDLVISCKSLMSPMSNNHWLFNDQGVQANYKCLVLPLTSEQWSSE